jgi:hypothetical protein
MPAPRNTVKPVATTANRKKSAAPTDPLAIVRALCMALPGVNERLSHGSPTYFINDKKTFATFVDDHHGDGNVGIWCAAPPGVQREMVDEEPDRFFVPPYVGGRGWLGVRVLLETGSGPGNLIDVDELREIITDAYLQVAPKKLAAQVVPQNVTQSDG